MDIKRRKLSTSSASPASSQRHERELVVPWGVHRSPLGKTRNLTDDTDISDKVDKHILKVPWGWHNSPLSKSET
eukprot:4617260-Amphidinium_carterae.1